MHVRHVCPGLFMSMSVPLQVNDESRRVLVRAVHCHVSLGKLLTLVLTG